MMLLAGIFMLGVACFSAFTAGHSMAIDRGGVAFAFTTLAVALLLVGFTFTVVAVAENPDMVRSVAAEELARVARSP